MKYRHNLRPEDFPLPETDRELEIITEIYFGIPLHLNFAYLGQYEVMEKYNTYHGKGFDYSENCCEGYDHSGAFWRVILGDLYCGGIASRSYGQFRINGYRQKTRLEKWIKNRGVGANYVRKPFLRLADKYGIGENRMTSNSSVLTDSREDGVSGAS